MNETSLTIRGSVGTDPTMRTLANGTTVTSFRLASTERRWDRELGQYIDGRTLWITVTCWRQLSLNVAASLSKGQRVIVRGRLFESEWESEGLRRSRVELEAETVGHDLVFGTAGFTRLSNESGRAADRTPPEGIEDADQDVNSGGTEPGGTELGDAARGGEGSGVDAQVPLAATSSG